MQNNIKKIFITGGGGYVGSVLVPILLSKGYKIDVLDLMIFGENVLPSHPNLRLFKGDIRDTKLLKEIIPGNDAVIHMACISNDPSFDLDPNLSKKINLDSFRPLVEISKLANVRRFIHTSTSSVYGLKSLDIEVTEDLSLNPITGYNTCKANCEKILSEYESLDFSTVNIRPATICGFSPRQRLDVVVNILTNIAYHKREITIFGGEQLRPNIHIKDLSNIFLKVIEAPKEKISGESFNAGSKNYSVKQIAKIVKKIIGEDVKIVAEFSDDKRSYHINSDKVSKQLGFTCKYSIEDAIKELKLAFDKKIITNTFLNNKFSNVELMKNLNIDNK